MSAYIDTHRNQYGVEPICRTLGLAPSTYYAAKTRPPSARALRDEAMKPRVERVYESNYRVYGRHKVWRQLRREAVAVGRDQVGRLMRELGICGVVRGKVKRTTALDPRAERAPDLVDRRFVAERPNRLWVADFTYAATWAHTVYVAFVIDVFSRRIVGWRPDTSMRTDLVLDALEMAIWSCDEIAEGLVCHSDAGSRYLAIRYPERLGEIGAAPFGRQRRRQLRQRDGRVGDRPVQDRAACRHGPWRHLAHLELAILEWVDWFNHRRLHREIGDIPPAEYEAAHYRQITTHELAKAS